MRSLIVEPGKEPYVMELPDLGAMQTAVGGYIEVLYPFEEEVVLVCDEEASIKGLPVNRSLDDDWLEIRGPFFICGTGEEDFEDLTDEQIERYAKLFRLEAEG